MNEFGGKNEEEIKIELAEKKRRKRRKKSLMKNAYYFKNSKKCP